MRDLIVIGASGEKCSARLQIEFADALGARFPGRVFYADDREVAFAMLEEPRAGGAVLAYAPGVFGDAAAGGKLSPRIVTTEPQVILTALRPEELETHTWNLGGILHTADRMKLASTDDPRQFLEAALAMLGVSVALNVLSETHLDVLATFLSGTDERQF